MKVKQNFGQTNKQTEGRSKQRILGSKVQRRLWHLSHTFDLARNERGLIEDRHFVDKHGAANRCGDHLVSAFKMCEVVLDIYKHDYLL